MTEHPPDQKPRSLAWHAGRLFPPLLILAAVTVVLVLAGNRYGSPPPAPPTHQPADSFNTIDRIDRGEPQPGR